MNTKVLKVSQCYSVKRDDNIHFSLFVWMSGAAAAALSGSVIFKDVCEMVKKKKNQITESKCTNRLFLSFLFHLQILEVCLVLSAFLQSSFKCLHWTVAEYFSLSLSLSLWVCVAFAVFMHLRVCVCVLGGDIRMARDGVTAVVKESPWLPPPREQCWVEIAPLCVKRLSGFPEEHIHVHAYTHTHTHTHTHTLYTGDCRPIRFTHDS